MTTMNDNNGCSICAAGSENYETFSTRIGRKRVKRVQYDYRHTDGELFSCIGGTLEDCRIQLHRWDIGRLQTTPGQMAQR